MFTLLNILKNSKTFKEKPTLFSSIFKALNSKEKTPGFQECVEILIDI